MDGWAQRKEPVGRLELRRQPRAASAGGVIQFLNAFIVLAYCQRLTAYVDRCLHILIYHLGRHQKLLAEHVKQAIASDQTNQVVFSRFRFRQPAGSQRHGKIYLSFAGFQALHRRLSAQWGITPTTVMSILETQALRIQVSLVCNGHATVKLTFPVVVEFFDSSIGPRLTDRNKHRLHSMMKTKPNNLPHPTRMSGAAVKLHRVVKLSILRQTKAIPDVIDRTINILLVGHRFQTTTSSCCIQGVETVKTQTARYVTRANEIVCRHVIRVLRRQGRVLLPLRLIASGASLHQTMFSQDTIHRAFRRQRINAPIFQLPKDCLGTTEQSLSVQVTPRRQNRRLHVGRRLSWVVMRTPRTILEPVLISLFITIQPFVKPIATPLQRYANRRGRFA